MDNVGEALDETALKKLKEHNRSIYQQKKEDAFALRKRLELWKEEKKKKKPEETKKRFITTVLKPVSQSKPLSSGNATTTHQGQTKPVVSKVMTQRKPAAVKPTTTKPVNGKAVESRNRQQGVDHKMVASNIKGREQRTTVCKAGKDVQRNITKVSNVQHTRHVKPAATKTKVGQRVAANTRDKKYRQKENQHPTTAVSSKAVNKVNVPRPSAKPPQVMSLAVSDCSKLTATDMTTPLSGNTRGFAQHHAITALTREGGGVEMVQPLNLADELHAAAVEDGMTSTSIMTEMGKTACDIEAYTDSSCTQPTKATKRNSLTLHFRKAKRLSNPLKKDSVPVARRSSQQVCKPLPAKKASRKSVHTIKPSITQPPRSILKRKSCAFNDKNSGLATSPELAASSAQSRVKTPGGGGEGTSCSHVNFTAGVEQAGMEGASYRKTPGRAKAQNLMRSKLNEWLEAKGRTPTSLRHACCFHSNNEVRGKTTPRSQIKACMSVEQLSKQETALTREDTTNIRKRLDLTITKSPTLSKTAPSIVRKTPGIARPPRNSPKIAWKEQKGKRLNKSGTQEDSGTQEENDIVEKNESSSGNISYSVEHGWEERGRRRSSRTRTTLSPMSSSLSLLQDEEREVDGRHTGREQLEDDYHKCLTALESGALGAEEALGWLDEVREASQEVEREASWYRCRVMALKIMDDEDALFNTFEMAIIHNAQPAEEMAQLLTDTMKQLLSDQTTRRRQRKRQASVARQASNVGRSRSCGQVVRRSEVQSENVFKSTTVKYSVTEVTPFKKRRRTTDTHELQVPVITPVRRSTRFATTHSAPRPCTNDTRPLPATPGLAEYSLLEDVPSAEKDRMLFQPNMALDTLLNEESPGRDSPQSVQDEDTSVPTLLNTTVDVDQSSTNEDHPVVRNVTE